MFIARRLLLYTFFFTLFFANTYCIGVKNHGSYVRLQAPFWNVQLHGFTIESKVHHPEAILIEAIRYDTYAHKQELMGSAFLNSINPNTVFLYQFPSFNPWNKAEYRIYAHRIDPDTKAIIEPISCISDVITVRTATHKQRYSSCTYAPFNLKRTVTKQEQKYIAGTTALALVLATSVLRNYVCTNSNLVSRKKHPEKSSQEITLSIMTPQELQAINLPSLSTKEFVNLYNRFAGLAIDPNLVSTRLIPVEEKIESITLFLTIVQAIDSIGKKKKWLEQYLSNNSIDKEQLSPQTQKELKEFENIYSCAQFFSCYLKERYYKTLNSADSRAVGNYLEDQRYLLNQLALYINDSTQPLSQRVHAYQQRKLLSGIYQQHWDQTETSQLWFTQTLFKPNELTSVLDPSQYDTAPDSTLYSHLDLTTIACSLDDTRDIAFITAEEEAIISKSTQKIHNATHVTQKQDDCSQQQIEDFLLIMQFRAKKEAAAILHTQFNVFNSIQKERYTALNKSMSTLLRDYRTANNSDTLKKQHALLSQLTKYANIASNPRDLRNIARHERQLLLAFYTESFNTIELADGTKLCDNRKLRAQYDPNKFFPFTQES